ncbi:MAG: EAL domain-containing protein [Comamonadaceae bacterium]|nr:EAL domain-containing protein [Comamonadaceae bacterium]
MQHSLRTASPEALGPGNSGSLLRVIADAVPASIAYYEASTLRCRFANERYARSCGQSTASILGMHAQDSVGATTWKIIEPYTRRCAAGEAVRYTREQLDEQGQRRMMEVHLIPHLQEGRQLGIFVMIHDITHHWQAERAVRESNERMRKFSAATQESLVFHKDGRVLDGNEALERLVGLQVADVIGHSILDYVAPEYRQSVIDYIAQGREDTYEIAVLHRDGHSIPVEVVGKSMPHEGQEYRIAVLRDITARRQAQEHLAFIALHDHLTQLPNRRYLTEQLGKTLARLRLQQGRAALLFINLDHFKTVNESLGHQVGDTLLCEMAQRLKATVRACDLVARLGSDEFVVLLPDLGLAQEAAQVADKLLATIGRPHKVGGLPVSLSPSIGISLFPEDGDEPEELLRHADLAMAYAKESGRANRQFYQASMDARTPHEELRLERQLREAIARQEFVLHYQPQVHLADARLAGFEALVRWQHPERGLVGPDEFIAFAEARGLITPIGRWVLHEACRQLQAWHAAGLPTVPIAVNISALELRQRDVLADIRQVLHDTGLAPQYLEIEITESVLLQQSGTAAQMLAALQALGVGVSIDDFGTGYSSLAYLKRYPIDKLKIDRSFVIDTPDSQDDVAIVTAIIQMGHSLQLRVVAEGVETPAQQALLQRLGCDLVQGYGLSRPLAADQVRPWWEAWQARGGLTPTP